MMGEKEFNVKALLFDFDGTLADTNGLHYQAFRKVFKRHGFDLPPEAIVPFFGKPGVQVTRNAKKILGMPDVKELAPVRLHDEMLAEYDKICRDARVDAGTVRALKRLKSLGFRMAICTGSQERHLAEVLRGNRKLFDAVFLDNHEFPGKPSPALFLAAAKALKAKPSECAVVGDSHLDIEAGNRAKMLTVAKLDKWSAPYLFKATPLLVVGGIPELLKLLKKCPQRLSL